MKKRYLLFVLLFGISFILSTAQADWVPADGHKMHFPQLPDEIGWDANATQPMILADDWQCSQSGIIEDIHFWGSWRDMDGDGIGNEGQIQSFVLSIHDDIPAGTDGVPFSRPGTTLREWTITQFTAVPIDPPTLEGWFEPSDESYYANDHDSYFQYNVIDLPSLVVDPFDQVEGTIYWLNISAILVDPVGTQWGWKTSIDHFNDDAVWAQWGNLSWIEMYEPPRYNEFDVTFTPSGFDHGGGTNFYGEGWYNYVSGWSNIWFYDNPYNTDNFKQIDIQIDVTTPTGAPADLTFAVNWSTALWSTQGNPPSDPDRRPPLPSDFVGTTIPETDYIGRHTFQPGPLPPGQYTFSYTIPDFNPEWVSIDVMGTDFSVFGSITHECVRTSMDLAFVINSGAGSGDCDYYKPGYPDYAPNGIPDFDQKQNQWTNPTTGAWSWCGPVALANCFWWFDSKFETNTAPPPTIADNYPLVETVGGSAWDDHDAQNVIPFITELASHCNTDPAGSSGTEVFDLEQGAISYLTSKGLENDYTVTLLPVDGIAGSADFDHIRQEVLRSQNVILLLGFWQDVGVGETYCERIGGHYVTIAGVCSDLATDCICISDPMFDVNEGEPLAGSVHGSAVHNDASNVSGPHGTNSHDHYNVIANACPPIIGSPPFAYEVQNYAISSGNVPLFANQNAYPGPPNVDPVPGAPIHTVIEWALIICPVETIGACCFDDGSCLDLTLPDCQTQGGTYMGNGTQCLGDLDGNLIDDACETIIPTGACCFADGSCSDLSATDCQNQSGAYQGDGTVCLGDNNGDGVDDACTSVVPVGACCFADGTCSDLTSALCQQQGGTYQGDGSQCLGDNNGDGVDDACASVVPVGACCFNDGSCQVMMQSACTPVVGGIYQGDGTNCASVTCPTPSDFKWRQEPDLSPNGVDVNMSEPLLLADDFECIAPGPITEISVWCSWFNDIYPPGGPGEVAFTLSLHTDIPATPGITFPPACPYFTQDPDGFVIINGLQVGATLQQTGSLRDFVSIVSNPGGSLGGNLITFDATLELSVSGTGPMVGFNRTLSIPVSCVVHTAPMPSPGSPWAIDLFSMQGEIFGDPDFCIYRVRAGSAFGLPSPGETTLTDMGNGTFQIDSFFDVFYEIDFQGCPGSILEGFAGTTQGNALVRTDASCIVPNTGQHSMPGQTLCFQNFQPGEFTFEEVLVTEEGWYDPSTQQYVFPGDHNCWKYTFTIPTGCFVQEGTPIDPIIYWLDVQARPNSPLIPALIGWKTTIDHWNDDAVWAMGAEPFPGPWNELRYPPQHPFDQQSIDLSFEIIGTASTDTCIGQLPGDANGDGTFSPADLLYLIAYLHASGPAPTPHANGDPNGDCRINQYDIDYLQAWMFGLPPGPAPVPCTCVEPFPWGPCCIGTGGNANLNPDEIPTVGDIAAIVDNLFGTGATLPCLEEADANRTGTDDNPPLGPEDITVGDIAKIVDHLFGTGDPMLPCP